MSENEVKRRKRRKRRSEERKPTEKMDIIEGRELDKNNTDRGPV